jgi:ATP-dependent helicase/nuclease subunit A
MYFKEDGAYVLADFKSGRYTPGKPGEEQRIKRRYAGQIDLYRQALEEITGTKVKEALLYMIDAPHQRIVKF